MPHQAAERIEPVNSLVLSAVSAAVAIPALAWRLRVGVDVASNVAIGEGSLTATTANAFMPANSIEYFNCSPGQTIAIVAAGAGRASLGRCG